jgi:hypothetical protein
MESSAISADFIPPGGAIHADVSPLAIMFFISQGLAGGRAEKFSINSK